jgi:hypothetical protein
VTLVTDSTSPELNTGQDPGFFTTVSSNGTQAGTGIIWAVSRPVNTNPANVTLYAFNAATGATLYSARAGTWPSSQSNANLVPVVANGLVYVASYQQLAVFGPGGLKPSATIAGAEAPATAEQDSRVFGQVKSIDGSLIMVQTRTGLLEVDTSQAQNDHLSAVPVVGNALMVRGRYDAAGVLHAQTVLRAKSSPDLWEPDR